MTSSGIAPVQYHLIVAGTCPRKGQPALSMDEVGFIWETLAAHHDSIASITTGAADGVDYEGLRYAREHRILAHEFPADWAAAQANGNRAAAGPIRNRHMVRTTIRRYGVKNILWLGFTRVPLEQSRGTANCYQYASSQGINTHHFRLDTRSQEF